VTPHQLRHTYGTSLINGGMSLQAVMSLLGHVTAEMTLRYASLASTTVRAAHDQAMNKARSRLTLPIAPIGKAIVPDRVQWLRPEMLKTRVTHGYCSRNLVAESCSYASICEQCDNFTTSANSSRHCEPSSPTSPSCARTPKPEAGTPKSPATPASS